MILYNDENVQIGLLEFVFNEATETLHVTNVVNLSRGHYKGVGPALMNQAIKFANEKAYGLSFEIARGSEGFYGKWIPLTFNKDESDKKTANLFNRIFHSLENDITTNLTNRPFSYTYNQVNAYKKINLDNDFASIAKLISTPNIGLKS
jgi:hypothetical protein